MNFSCIFILTFLIQRLVAATATGVYNGCPTLDFTWHTNQQNIVNYSMDITEIEQIQDELFEITIHVTGAKQIPLKYLYSLKVIGVNGPKGTVQLYGKNENTYLIDNPTDFTTTFQVYATLKDCQYWMPNFQIQFEYMQGDAAQYWQTWVWGTSTFDLGTGCTNYDNQGHSQTDFPGFYWVVGLPSECVADSLPVSSIETTTSEVATTSTTSSSSSESSRSTTDGTTTLAPTTASPTVKTYPPFSRNPDDDRLGSVPTGWPSGWVFPTTSSTEVESSVDADFRTRSTVGTTSTLISSSVDQTTTTQTTESPVDPTTTVDPTTSVENNFERDPTSSADPVTPTTDAGSSVDADFRTRSTVTTASPTVKTYPPFSRNPDDDRLGSVPTGWPSGWVFPTTSSTEVESSVDADFRTRSTVGTASTLTNSPIDPTTTVETTLASDTTSSFAESTTSGQITSSAISTSISADPSTSKETISSADPTTVVVTDVTKSDETILSFVSSISSSSIPQSSHSLDAQENFTSTSSTSSDFMIVSS